MSMSLSLKKINEKGGVSTVFSISENTISYLKVPNNLTCCGSSHGWLILVDDKFLTVSLHNPITRTGFDLPPIKLMNFNEEQYSQFIPSRSLVQGFPSEDCLIHKVVLSSNPIMAYFGYGDCTAMAIYGESRKLAYCKLGDNCWTRIEDSKSYYDDIVYCESKGCFFAVDEYGAIVVCEIDPYPMMTEIVLPRPFKGNKLYLVDSIWGLLLVVRFTCKIGTSCYRTVNFEVFRVSPLSDECLRMTSLYGSVLFLGKNHSVSLFAEDVSHQRNCIYFSDDHQDGDACDEGIFNLEDDNTALLLSMS